MKSYAGKQDKSKDFRVEGKNCMLGRRYELEGGDRIKRTAGFSTEYPMQWLSQAPGPAKLDKRVWSTKPAHGVSSRVDIRVALFKSISSLSLTLLAVPGGHHGLST